MVVKPMPLSYIYILCKYYVDKYFCFYERIHCCFAVKLTRLLKARSSMLTRGRGTWNRTTVRSDSSLKITGLFGLNLPRKISAFMIIHVTQGVTIIYNRSSLALYCST